MKVDGQAVTNEWEHKKSVLLSEKAAARYADLSPVGKPDEWLRLPVLQALFPARPER
jgi:hypothetical protein